MPTGSVRKPPVSVCVSLRAKDEEGNVMGPINPRSRNRRQVRARRPAGAWTTTEGSGANTTLSTSPFSSCCPLALHVRFSSVKTASVLSPTATSAYTIHQWSDWRINKGSLLQLRQRCDLADPITSYLLVFSWFILLSITALEMLYLTWYNSHTLH